MVVSCLNKSYSYSYSLPRGAAPGGVGLRRGELGELPVRVICGGRRVASTASRCLGETDPLSQGFKGV